MNKTKLQECIDYQQIKELSKEYNELTKKGKFNLEKYNDLEKFELI